MQYLLRMQSSKGWKWLKMTRPQLKRLWNPKKGQQLPLKR
jgi:hypothetical protein